MPEMVDVVSGDAFSVVNLTATINNQPFVPTRIREMGLFEEKPIPTTKVALEQINGTLRLVESKQRGGPKQQRVDDKRTVRTLSTIHLPVEDHLQADELQNVRAFGSADGTVGVQQMINAKLAAMGADLDVTIEHLRIGALKGKVVDADGSSVILNLFNEFDVAQPAEVNFDLTNANPGAGAVKKKCSAVIRSIQNTLGAALYDHIHAFVSPEFMDDLASHPEVEEAYRRHQESMHLRGSQVRDVFTYAGITFEEYRGSVNGTDFIAANKAHFFPVGVPGLFIQPNGPANFLDTVNTMGLPKYAKIGKPDQYDEGVPLTAQANPLPICTKPGVLIQGKRA